MIFGILQWDLQDMYTVGCQYPDALYPENLDIRTQLSSDIKFTAILVAILFSNIYYIYSISGPDISHSIASISDLK
jgi:hypothetical protein